MSMQPVVSNRPHISRVDLFLTFSRITLSSFGGALFWARLGLVERQRWLTDREFAEFLTIGQLLPGPNVLNLTVLVGYRLGGWSGAAVSVADYLGWPFLVVIGMGMRGPAVARCRRCSRRWAACLRWRRGCCSRR